MDTKAIKKISFKSVFPIPMIEGVLVVLDGSMWFPR